jgi:hypothetical protein
MELPVVWRVEEEFVIAVYLFDDDCYRADGCIDDIETEKYEFV